jgi:AraC-like DNA-binding protein
MEDPIKQAVATIRRHYEEPLHLDDLARIATMSKFHFLRSFRDHTEITPARYLTAVRIQAAKHLLHQTNLGVIDISNEVGYGSLGTFTTRFSECVGLSPMRYRRMVNGEPLPLPMSTAEVDETDDSGPYGSMSGVLRADRRITGPVMLGLFPTRIPQGRPAACVAVDGLGRWSMPRIPAGAWHLLGVSVLGEMSGGPATQPEDVPLLVADPTIIHIVPNSQLCLDVQLRGVRWTDPPLLVALPGVDARAPAQA